MSRIQSEAGGTLIVGLITLLVMTLVGVSSMQVTSLEEKMAGNSRDRDLAFQAAESALRAGEAWLHDQAEPPPHRLFKCDNTQGLYKTKVVCPMPQGDGGFPEAWETIDGQGWNNQDQVMQFVGTLAQIDETRKPGYIIEEVQRGGVLNTNLEAGTPSLDRTMYRITARATGGTPDAVVIVQSTFKK